MSPVNNQKEILLIVNSRFISKAWVKRDAMDDNNNFSKKEQLIDACWNGMAPEILPECFDALYDKSVTLCEINDANSFIDLVFGRFVPKNKKEFSVNPYRFMQVQGFN